MKFVSLRLGVFLVVGMASAIASATEVLTPKKSKIMAQEIGLTAKDASVLLATGNLSFSCFCGVGGLNACQMTYRGTAYAFDVADSCQKTQNMVETLSANSSSKESIKMTVNNVTATVDKVWMVDADGKTLSRKTSASRPARTYNNEGHKSGDGRGDMPPSDSGSGGDSDGQVRH